MVVFNIFHLCTGISFNICNEENYNAGLAIIVLGVGLTIISGVLYLIYKLIKCIFFKKPEIIYTANTV